MRPAAAIAMIALAPLSAALADVYRSVDAQGHVLYSDTPMPGAQLVHTTGVQRLSLSAPTNAPATSAPAARQTSPSPKEDAPRDPKAQEAAARAVQDDVAQTRADQCKQARDAYEKSVQARRIYSVGADGERSYLSDDEAEQQRVNNKLHMDEACKDVQP